MTHRNRARHTAGAILATVCALFLSACGGAEPGEAGDKVVITVEPSAIPAFVAQAEGFFKETGADIEVSAAGYDAASSLLITGDTQIAWVGPLEAAQFVSEGEDFVYLSTAGAQNMYNGVVVRAEDADKYSTIADLRDKRLGIPGFGTGTWADFAVFAKVFYGIDDARNAYETATADSGALLALLEKGELDAALLFAADSASSRYSNKFKTVFSFTDVLQEKLGQPLPVNGPVANEAWLKTHPKQAAAVIAGLDKAVEWMKRNPQEFAKGGKYSNLAKAGGWYSSAAATEGILKLLVEGKWYLTSDAYTDQWRDAIYQVVKGGEGSLVETVPPIDAFLAPANSNRPPQ